MIEADTQAACGPRHARCKQRTTHRWVKTKGKIGFHRGKVEIERPQNVMGTLRRVCRNVKHWRSPSMALRWTGAAMQEAGKGFRRLKAHKQLPILQTALAPERHLPIHPDIILSQPRKPHRLLTGDACLALFNIKRDIPGGLRQVEEQMHNNTQTGGNHAVEQSNTQRLTRHCVYHRYRIRDGFGR